MADCDSEDNKLRYTFRFKWSDSLVMDGKPVVHQDCQFDVCSILMEVAIWLTKYGARVAAKSEITENDAKVVHKSFKQACGIFQLIKTESAKLLGFGLDNLIYQSLNEIAFYYFRKIKFEKVFYSFQTF